MDRLQSFHSDMRVKLCRGEGSVTKQLLDGAQVCTAFQQVGCRAMPKTMRTHTRRTGHSTHRGMHNGSDNPLIDPSTTRSEEQRCR